MPLHSYPPPLITVRVTDITQGETRYAQIARFTALQHGQSGTGEINTTVSVVVQLHELTPEGEPGDPLIGRGIRTYDITLSTDNNTLADMQTGATVASRTPGEVTADWLARCEAFTAPVMLQGEYFGYLRDTQSVQIGGLIRHHIQQADQMGRFA